MTANEKIRRDTEEAEELYRKLDRDAQMYFCTLMNLAAILFKTVRKAENVKR